MLLEKPDTDLINDVFDQLGCTPRLCLEKVQTRRSLDARRTTTLSQLDELSARDFEKMVNGSRSMGTDEVSYTTCLLSRTDETIWHADRETISAFVQVSPITPFIGSKLAIHFRNLARSEQIRLYKYFAVIPSTRGMTGNIFEAYCQRIFQEEIHLQLVRMVRLPESDPNPNSVNKKRKLSEGSVAPQEAPRRTNHPRWHSSHTAIDDERLEAMRLTALGKSNTLKIRPSATCEFDEIHNIVVTPCVYYIPSKTNQVALDSFILDGDGFLDISQFTGGKIHEINSGLISFLGKCEGIPPQDKWRFIFIIPDDVATLKCPVPKNTTLQTLPLYSAMVVLEDETSWLSKGQHLLQGWWNP